jgi:hypothetical protein
VADILALIAAFLLAVAATLQQKGALNLPKISLAQEAAKDEAPAAGAAEAIATA